VQRRQHSAMRPRRHPSSEPPHALPRFATHWAARDLNPCRTAETPEKIALSENRAAPRAALLAPEAVSAILALPLSDAERAEALRLLLLGGD
jgi:hypothetical protein